MPFFPPQQHAIQSPGTKGIRKMQQTRRNLIVPQHNIHTSTQVGVETLEHNGAMMEGNLVAYEWANQWQSPEAQHQALVNSVAAGHHVVLEAGPQNPRYMWPSSMLRHGAQPNPHDGERYRRDSGWTHDSSCDPLSTMLPTTTAAMPATTTAPTMWEPSPYSTYEHSPGLSDYSNSAHPSGVPSPYAQPEAFLHVANVSSSVVEDVNRHTSQASPLREGVLVDPSAINVDMATMVIGERLENSANLQPIMELDNGSGTMTLGRSHSISTTHSDVESESGVSVNNSEEGDGNEAHDAAWSSRRRRHTRPEDANCWCTICGRLFRRSYNLRAHMQTHDPDRPQPHECTYPRCKRGFGRRADLQRHIKCIHLRSRDYVCLRCRRAFARNDTLQRHVDQGCSHRPQVKKRAQPRQPAQPRPRQRQSRAQTQHLQPQQQHHYEQRQQYNHQNQDHNIKLEQMPQF